MIKINNQYSTFHDKRQWHLMEKVASKGDKKKNLKGEELEEFHEEDKYVVLGYYYRLDHMAIKIANRLDLNDRKDLQDLTDAYDDLTDALTNLLKAQTKE
jgi:hypothetical protein